MGPMSFDTLTTTLFQALSDIEDFSYSSEQLKNYYDTIKPDKKTNKKQMKTSAYKMFLSENAGKHDKPNWKDIKEDPLKFIIYANLAQQKNIELGFSINQNPILAKKLKTKNKNDALKAAILAEKQKKNIIILSPNTSQNIHTTDSHTLHNDITFDSIDINSDGVISREEFDKIIHHTTEDVPEHTTEDVPEHTTEDVPEHTTEDVPEHTTDDVPEHTTDDVPEHTTEEVIEQTTDDIPEYTTDDIDKSNLPLFIGKSPQTALNNFKQWLMNEKQFEFNSKISRDDMTTYKNEYNFDKDKYDENALWFQFIQNNMRTE